MKAGYQSGTSHKLLRKLQPSVGVFLTQEEGSSSLAVALSLLLSFALLFSSLNVHTLLRRSADVQPVADAAALAGANVVSSYASIAEFCDACTLSLGLAGFGSCAAGLITACIPGMGEAGLEIFARGRDLLDARNDFARSSARGLQQLEGYMPALIMANAASSVKANQTLEPSAWGSAIAFPQESHSDFSGLDGLLEVSELEELTEQTAEASDEASSAQEELDEALYKGWEADCGRRPRCMRERASTLAGLTGSANPDYASPDTWNFSVAIKRARLYYERRLQIEAPLGADIESKTDSVVREAFYRYALVQLEGAYEREVADGHVEVYVPEFIHNATEARSSSLYTDSIWPCTQEESGRVLHSCLECPAAQGAAAGTASLAQLEAGELVHCETCRMDIGDVGKVAAASTTIDNGFEYYWRLTAKAAEDYTSASKELAAANKKIKAHAEQSLSKFEELLQSLQVPQMKLCPPGAWGCVALVGRGSTEGGDSVFSSSFELSRGAAIAAAVVAPDEASATNNVLANVLDGIAARSSSGFVDAADKVLEAWSGVLLAYGNGTDSLSSMIDELLESASPLIGSDAARWLKSRISSLVDATGLAPRDLRVRKAVLTSSQNVLQQAGYGNVNSLRTLILALPNNPSAKDVLSYLGQSLPAVVPTGEITIAYLRIPGTEIDIPLTINLSELSEVLS